MKNLDQSGIDYFGINWNSLKETVSSWKKLETNWIKLEYIGKIDHIDWK